MKVWGIARRRPVKVYGIARRRPVKVKVWGLWKWKFGPVKVKVWGIPRGGDQCKWKFKTLPIVRGRPVKVKIASDPDTKKEPEYFLETWSFQRFKKCIECLSKCGEPLQAPEGRRAWAGWNKLVVGKHRSCQGSLLMLLLISLLLLNRQRHLAHLSQVGLNSTLKSFSFFVHSVFSNFLCLSTQWGLYHPSLEG